MKVSMYSISVKNINEDFLVNTLTTKSKVIAEQLCDAPNY